MEFKHAGLKIEIDQDLNPENPRSEMFDNLATMVFFHKRYTLGDKDHGYSDKDYGNWEAMEQDIIKRDKPACILPVYMYDHSGLAISTERTGCFADQWDSGQIGFVFVSKAKARREYKKLTKETHEKILEILKGEIETYNQYLRGDVWEYTIKDENDETLDSCCGFYGQDYCIENAKDAAEHMAERAAKLD